VTPLLELRNIWVEYGDKIVLERVSLEIAERSFVAVVGPSGAGKSTFLRLILGQEAPTRGEVLLDGKPMRPECGPDRGVVFQRYSVFPHLTALRNVMFGIECAQAPFAARLFGAQRRAARETAIEMLAAVGLDHSLEVYPAQMSGGMQQRLAIAQLITRLWQERGLTIVMVTHDIGEAFKLGTRVLAFDKRRHDPHAPHRFGATTTYDLPLDRKTLPPQALVDAIGGGDLPRPDLERRPFA
jgi:NitT/TauT family transport system ATP-binding protein